MPAISPTPTIEPGAQTFSVLSANIGNLSLGCLGYNNKPCYKDVEERMAANMRALAPQIVALQEVLPDWQCRKLDERDPKKICFQYDGTTQMRRLLGPEYTVLCDDRNQYVCIAVRTDFAEIVGCPAGEICNRARITPEFEGCDNGFVSIAATLRTKTGEEFDLLSVHLQSTSAQCRVTSLRYIFGDGSGTTPMIQSEKVLVMGDFNFDPWRDRGPDIDAWNEVMRAGWMGSPLGYHSAIAESDLPLPTSRFLLMDKTIDFVASNFLQGICTVQGESPETTRLDGGDGMDHRGLFGMLSYKAKQ